jgi:hypothetical protein
MTIRSLANAGLALGIAAAIGLSAAPARAVPVQITVSIDFASASELFNNLSGQATIYAASSAIKVFDVDTLVSDHSNFSGNFIPVDPCVGGGTCTVAFSFGGLSGSFPAYAFMSGNESISDPGSAWSLPIGSFIPGDPCFSGGVCSAGGTIFAYDDSGQVGTWSVTIAATPLPPALALFAGGLGLFGWFGRRRLAAS